MKLAKPAVDLGLMARDIPATLAFWQREIGARFDERLETFGGSVQHRHDLLGSVLKINESPTPLPKGGPPGGIRELWVARPGLEVPKRLRDPDGNVVVLVPPGYEGVTQLGFVLGVRDAAAFDDFYRDVLQLEELRPGAHRCGESLLVHRACDDATESKEGFPAGAGYRYLTIQIHDCQAEHTGIVARGGREALAPQRLRDVARFSMVADPDGTWIEISQRADLCGPLD